MARLGTDDSENRDRRHVSCSQVVVVVTGVVPGFVNEPDVVYGGQDFASRAVDDDRRRRERATVVVGATDKDIRARSNIDAGRHAHWNRVTVDDGRDKGGASTGQCDRMQGMD